MEIAVLVNLHARRAGDRVLRTVRRVMPEARLVTTRSLRDAVDAAAELHGDPPDLLVSAGGDGTAVTLLTALRDAASAGQAAQSAAGGASATGQSAVAPMAPVIRPAPPLALLPLGTGNGWAHALGAPRWRTA